MIKKLYPFSLFNDLCEKPKQSIVISVDVFGRCACLFVCVCVCFFLKSFVIVGEDCHIGEGSKRER